MEREIIEHNKTRSLRLDTGYMYQESVKDPITNGVVGFLSMVKESDYSFSYINFNMDTKMGIFYIEEDSVFIEPFRNLVADDEEFRIEDDYSERFIRLFKDDKGGVILEVHMLPGEYDISIELKNIMFDLRSQADQDGKDTKKRLSQFFDELVQVYDKMPEEEQQKLVNQRDA